MKPRGYFAVTFIFALFVCLAFLNLPVIGVNETKAELPKMPTYDKDTDGEVYPDLDPLGYYDAYIFRTVQCMTSVIVDKDDINELLLPIGYVAAVSKEDPTEVKVNITWIYRIYSQWPTNTMGYQLSTHETIGSLSVGVPAIKPGFGPRYLILADVRSPNDAVTLNNETAGNGANVSRGGDLKMEFKSRTKRNGKSTLRFKAKVKEPISGLKINVHAILPEGQEALRGSTNNLPPPAGLVRILYMDLSKTPVEQGLPFQWWSQKEEYMFDDTVEDFELEVKIANSELKLPGGHVLPIKRILQTLSLQRNVEGYIRFE